MKICDMRSGYYEKSEKVSELSRQFAFAGIAIIWVLKVGNDSGGIPFSTELVIPLYSFVIVLVLDLLQYLYQTAAWGILNHFYWRKYRDDDVNIKVSEIINWPAILFFWGKVTVIVFGYFHLLQFIHSKL